ncbi:MAG: sensor histidine kinase [Planctomycetota bacterium]
MQQDIPPRSRPEIDLDSLLAVAHEMLDPLTAAAASAELLAARDLPGDAAPLAGRIARGARYCQLTARALLGRNLSEGTTPRPVRLCTLLDSVRELSTDVAATGQRVEDRCPPELFASADPALLECALLNLVRNALRARSLGCRVVLTARPAGDAVHVDVADNGPGLPSEVTDRLFELAGPSSRGRGAGGLGLWLAATLVRASGGKLSLLRSGPEGCAFRAALPSLPGPAAGPAPGRDAREAPAGVRGGKGNRLRVLVVEDDREVADVIREVLSTFGHTSERASNIGQSMDRLERQAFDAVTLDVGLGTESGLDLYGSILRRWPDLARRVVLCSAAPADLARRRFPGQAPLLLRKPFETAELVDAVGRAAGRR